jgi:hypothetical protein
MPWRRPPYDYEWHAFWIKAVMEDFRALRLRYNAAFDAYHELATLHAKRFIEGDPPSTDELIHERRTLEELDAARRALLAALAPISDRR